jgi:hemerythrin superfamily protein
MPNVSEESITQAAGELGSFKAKVNGLDGVFRRLTEEHKEVAILLQRAGMTRDPNERAELWRKVRQELDAHERAELQIVYSELELHPSLTEIVRRHAAEAEQLQVLMANLDAASYSSAQWEGSLNQLEQAVLQHAEIEEEDFFPKAQAVVGEERAQQLEYKYLQVKKVIIRGVQ